MVSMCLPLLSQSLSLKETYSTKQFNFKLLLPPDFYTICKSFTLIVSFTIVKYNLKTKMLCAILTDQAFQLLQFNALYTFKGYCS